jgi:phosphatidylglycerophosphate synthase
MFDINLRPLKDSLFDPICSVVPRYISPSQITGAAFLCGISCCIAAALGNIACAVGLWVLNRTLDCLDGAVARHRQQSSDLGGFLDLLGDFIVYAAIPICCALGNDILNPAEDLIQLRRRWLAVAVAESSFYVNSFILFFLAAVAEKKTAEEAKQADQKAGSLRSKELTSVTMRPALVEGFESGLAFSGMLAFPQLTEHVCWILTTGVIVGIIQRTKNAVSVLSKDR